MKILDQPNQAVADASQLQCLRVVCPLILPAPDQGNVASCITPLPPPDYVRIVEALKVELSEVCARGFYLACGKFGRIVGPICPFDPAPEARIDRLTVKVEELTAKVEELRPRK